MVQILTFVVLSSVSKSFALRAHHDLQKQDTVFASVASQSYLKNKDSLYQVLLQLFSYFADFIAQFSHYKH